MQFYAIAILAVAVMAAPIAQQPEVAERDVASDVARDVDVTSSAPAVENPELAERGIFSDIKSEINKTGQAEFGPDCDVTGCAAALAPLAAGCGGAASMAFVDPILDAACLATSLNDVANKPSECDKCSL